MISEIHSEKTYFTPLGKYHHFIGYTFYSALKGLLPNSNDPSVTIHLKQSWKGKNTVKYQLLSLQAA